MSLRQLMMFGLGLACLGVGVMPAQAAGEAGKVLAARGAGSGTRADGGTRSLAVGSVVYSGETIRTAASAAAQIRFADGMLLSLPGGSEIRIDDYRYDGEENAFFTLIKGGLRTLTGKIGHKNRDNYRVNTPVATIGIRGTDYQLRLCLDDCPAAYANGLYLSVFAGAISARNEAGEFLLNFGESAFIPIWNAPLQRRPDIPQPLPVPPPGNNTGGGTDSSSGGATNTGGGGGSTESGTAGAGGDAGNDGGSVAGGGGGGGGSSSSGSSSSTGGTLSNLTSGPVTMFDGITSGQSLEFRAADVIRCIR